MKIHKKNCGECRAGEVGGRWWRFGSVLHASLHLSNSSLYNARHGGSGERRVVKIARLRVRKSEAAFLRPSRRIKTIASLCAICSFHGGPARMNRAPGTTSAQKLFFSLENWKMRFRCGGKKQSKKLVVFSGAKSVEVKVAIFPWGLAQSMTSKLLCWSAGNRRFSSLFRSFLQTQCSASASCRGSRRKSGRQSKPRQAGEVAEPWSSATVPL